MGYNEFVLWDDGEHVLANFDLSQRVEARG